jgi:hypothetical protein
MKTTTPEAASVAALQFLIDHFQNNQVSHGKTGRFNRPATTTALAEALSARTGKKIHRQMVEGWLNPDRDKAIEPKLGIGLLLIEEGKKLIEAPKKEGKK